MPTYIGGPAWPALDAALDQLDFPAVLHLAETDESVELPERLLVNGICQSLFHHADAAADALLRSFHAFSAERPERAAVAAVFLGRMHFWARDSPRVANGWFARARSLVADQPDVLEHALAALPLPGCDVADVSVLRRAAEEALALARRLGERNLEAKALADLGTALVSQALVDEGMTRLDEAMAMLLSGEAASPFVSGDIVCNMLTACGRVGDIARANEWTRAADEYLGIAVDEGPAYIYTHCRSVMGLILCDIGRWREAEVTLRLASSRAAQGGPRVEGKARAALAELCVLQGRLVEAERLIGVRRDHSDALLPLARLHLTRGEYEEAIGVAGMGVRQMGDDRVRAARLLGIVVQAQLALGDSGGAAKTTARLAELAGDRSIPVLSARAALARGLVAQHHEESDSARDAFELALRVLADDDWPLLRAELHLRLGGLLTGQDPSAAIAEARAAHLIYDRLGSPEAAKSALLLNSLGLQASSRHRPQDATSALSRREYEVLQLLRVGSSNAEIARQLHNSVRTIEHHVSAILTKLGLRSRTEAAVYAASLEMLTPAQASPATWQ
jgi:DNA-binding NarL/FixJ family response regulator